VTLLGKNYTIYDICYKPIADKGCLITSPMDFWKMNLQEMKDDTNVKETAKCLKKKFISDVPCSDRNGVPIQLDVFYN
jgi:Niemann-Pick C1 protein